MIKIKKKKEEEEENQPSAFCGGRNWVRQGGNPTPLL
jgi:hypothetical protein